MFNIGWGEFVLLVVAGLFILGPERLPAAAAWAGKAVRQVREYATGARDQLRSELGPEFDELRKPLEDLRGIRDFNPRTAMTKALFDDDEPVSLAKPKTKPNGYAAPTGNGTPVSDPLQPGERAPFDPDAT